MRARSCLRLLGASFVTGSASVLNLSDDNIKALMRHVHKAIKPYLVQSVRPCERSLSQMSLWIFSRFCVL